MNCIDLHENEDANLKSLDMTSLLGKRDDERFTRLTRLARKLFQVPIALISVMDRDCQRLLFWKGLNAPDNRSSVSFCEHAISNNGPFVVNDALQDSRFRDNPLVTGEPFIRFYAGCPVRLPDGTVVGTLCLIDPVPRQFSEEDKASLMDLAFIVEDEFQVINMAMTDSLTAIPNRRGFYRSGEKRFQEFRHADQRFSTLYFDLDQFKPINDRWGHNEGDEVLKNFAHCLRLHLGPDDIAGRLGGDEFVVMLACKNDTLRYLQRLGESVDTYNQRSAKPYDIGYSFGSVDSDSGSYASLEDMLRASDSVMYEQKQNKRQRQVLRGAENIF